MRLSEAIKDFVSLRNSKGPRARKTAARYESTLRIFCLCMQDPEVEQLDIGHVLWYFAELERLGWKPNGRNLIGLALRKFFEYCNLRGYQVFNEQLIPLPEKETNIPRVTDLKAFKKLIAQIPVKSNRPHHIRDRALALMLWDTGARSGEICLLDEDDLQFKKDGSGLALIKTEKSRGRRPIRQVFWTKETGLAVKRWLKKKQDLLKYFNFSDPEAVFISIGKCPGLDTRGRRMTNRGVCELMRVLSNKAGLPTVLNAHAVRHSMGRDTMKALKSNSAVSNILGHSNLESSYIYTMLWGEDLEQEWKQVMRRRGNPIARPPRFPAGFPKAKQRQIQGSLRPVVVKTSKYGRQSRT